MRPIVGGPTSLELPFLFLLTPTSVLSSSIASNTNTPNSGFSWISCLKFSFVFNSLLFSLSLSFSLLYILSLMFYLSLSFLYFLISIYLSLGYFYYEDFLFLTPINHRLNHQQKAGRKWFGLFHSPYISVRKYGVYFLLIFI